MKALSFILAAMLPFVPALAGATSDDISAPAVTCTVDVSNGNLVIEWTDPSATTTIVKYSVDLDAYYDTVPETDTPIVYEVNQEFEAGTVTADSPLMLIVPLGDITAYVVDVNTNTSVDWSYLEAKVKGLHHGQANRQNHARGIAACQ